ncbi:hypothetical protein BC835DRAFT_1254593, partial [Cytidiella melzeri]
TKERFFKYSTTTISKLTPLGTAAEIEWHRRLGNSVLQFRGRSVNVEDYIFKAGFWSSKQQFTSSSGRRYTWDENIVRWIPLRLFRALFARWHNKSLGILGKKHPPYLQISQDVLDDVDEIIVTLVYIRRMIQQRNSANNTAAAA